MAAAARIEAVERDSEMLVSAAGRWDVMSIGALDARLRGLKPGAGKPVRIDLAGVDTLDTAGA